MKTASEKTGIAYMTYQRIEHAEPVRPGTYAKLEDAFEFQPGSCRAVLEGRTGVVLKDGSEIGVGTQFTALSLSEEATQHLVADAVIAAAPQLTGHEIKSLTAELMKRMRKHGLLSVADVIDPEVVER